MKKFKKNDKVYVVNWGRRFSTIYKNDGHTPVWGWETKIPPYSDITFHWKREWTPKLTRKGAPYKDGSRVLVSEEPVYEDFLYKVEESTVRQMDGRVIYLLSSKEGCWIQMGEDGLTTMTPEEQEKVKHLEKKASIQALAKDNLGIWSIGNKNLTDFPERLMKRLYDNDRRILFGNGYGKGTVWYDYIPGEYTIDGVPILLKSAISTDSEISLEGKETVNWSDLKSIFINQNFKY